MKSKLLFAAIAAAALAACQGGDTNRALPAPTPSPAPTVCPVLVIAPPPLLYPANGATGIPDGNFNIVTGYAYGTTLNVIPPGGPAISTGPSGPAPSPLPSSTFTPGPFATPVAYAVPALRAATTYTVQGAVNLPSPCIAPVYTLGTFTTQ